MNRWRLGAAVAAGLGLAVALWFGSRPRGLTGPVSLRVRVVVGELRVPGDRDGNIRVFRPADPVRFELRLCGDPGGTTTLWTSPGRNPTWRAVPVAPTWTKDESCRVAVVEHPASFFWPDVPRGVARWTWVMGAGSDQLADPITPEVAWRRAPAMVDGEVVLRESP